MKLLYSRENKGFLICLVGILCNLALSAAKIATGLLTGFVSVLADGFNNLSDCGGGIVSSVSFIIAKKPADKKHPFGHQRVEYIASLVTGLLVMFLAVELLRESIESVINGDHTTRTYIVYVILSISVVLKAGMFALYRIFSKRLDSDALKAAATDSICDTVATLAVIVGAALSEIFPSADGWAGIAVSLFIAWQGGRILTEASSKLLGQAPDPALAKRIKAIILSDQQILGTHDLRIYSYGNGIYFATVHVEMDASLSMLTAHTAIDSLEAQIKRETGVTMTIHLDPVDLTNREESTLKIKVWEAARELTDRLEMHDFRIIPSTNKVEFDVGVPYECKLTDAFIEDELVRIVKANGDFEPVIKIDRE